METEELRQLTNDSGSEQQSAWSPDGARILFNSDLGSGGGAFDLYVMDVDGSDRQRLTTSPGHDEFGIWSPDGSMIAFRLSSYSGDQIAIMNADGTNRRILTSGPGLKVPDAWFMPAGPHQVPRHCH